MTDVRRVVIALCDLCRYDYRYRFCETKGCAFWQERRPSTFAERVLEVSPETVGGEVECHGADHAPPKAGGVRPGVAVVALPATQLSIGGHSTSPPTDDVPAQADQPSRSGAPLAAPAPACTCGHEAENHWERVGHCWADPACACTYFAAPTADLTEQARRGSGAPLAIPASVPRWVLCVRCGYCHDVTAKWDRACLEAARPTEQER